jgi:TP901 family phage tail tape measure protein
VAETRRDLIVRMTADPEAFKKGMREAGRDSKLFWKELKELEKQQKAVDEVMTVGGTVMVGFGAAAAAGLAVAAKAAIEWESAWTGVAKVVDGSPEQLAALEEELRGLATTLPQTHAEIAGVAAAAGQLGIAREDIAEFTETMVAMGVSTDLSSEQAAMSMARLMNIMQTAPDQVSNLGSAIVGLGNAGASTEAEIVEMALRIAGAGHTVGMTEAEVLAFSSALASVGIEAESGGSSISTAMIKISEAVNEGGDSLETFAQVAGVSADEFASKFRSDPAQAIDLFVQGLGRIQSSGGDVFATLETLGMSEIRLRDALLRLAGAGDLLTESLATGNEAWDENTALMEEAARRYGTTESQIAIAKNQLTDMGITLGENLLPMIRSFLDAGQNMFA